MRMFKRRAAGVWIILATFMVLAAGCISSDFNMNTDGTFTGTYNGDYSGSLEFDFRQTNTSVEAEGTIYVEGERVDFEGQGTLTKSPAVLTLDVSGSGFTMHVEGELKSGHLKGSYTFSSSRWGSDSGSVDLDLGK